MIVKWIETGLRGAIAFVEIDVPIDVHLGIPIEAFAELVEPSNLRVRAFIVPVV